MADALDPREVDWVPVFSVTIPGEPVPKGRPRVTKGGRAYTPAKTRAWERAAVAQMLATRPRPRDLEGPLRVFVAVMMKRPKRLYRKKDPDGPIFAPKRPDADNFGKAALDALQSAHVIRDDGQVVDLHIVKMYHSRDGEPHMFVQVSATEWPVES